MSVLDELVAAARLRAAALPKDGERVRCSRASFRDALRGRERMSVVAEFKRSSPSKGGIAPDADVETRVRGYRDAGAAAVSVLTEPSRFSGSEDDLIRAAATVDLPLLMKDFVVDVRQVRRAAEIGASAVLLIVRCLDDEHLHELAAACADFALTPLIECHDASEVDRALAVPDAVIGVNNRDLASLEIDLGNAPELLARVPDDRIAIAESGYIEVASVEPVRGIADAVLVGTALMQADDPAAFVRGVGGA